MFQVFQLALPFFRCSINNGLFETQAAGLGTEQVVSIKTNAKAITGDNLRPLEDRLESLHLPRPSLPEPY